MGGEGVGISLKRDLMDFPLSRLANVLRLYIIPGTVYIYR
jgi:hypothetical protein